MLLLVQLPEDIPVPSAIVGHAVPNSHLWFWGGPAESRSLAS